MIEGHGDDRYKYGPIRADFSSNVPEGIDHRALLEHLAAHLADISRYPEPEPYTLEKELAEHAGLAPAQVMVTNGATEAIYLAAHFLAKRGGCAAITEPTFAEYADACRLYGTEVEPIAEPYTVPADCRSLWCCNPNNPTGRVWERERLIRAIDARPETIFVVDQSYEAFTRKPLLTAQEAAARPNVILIHSMTKHYAVPGLRLGWLTANPALCEQIRCLRMPWSVNALAIEAGRFLLREGVGGFSLDGILAEAARLAGALGTIESSRTLSVIPGEPMAARDRPFRPAHTDTHFMLVEIAPGQGTAAELKEWLAREEGLLIRNADNFPGLTPRHFRIAAQSPAGNDLLITALQRWIRR
jgi:threonine-phosphate decarboxylase